MFRKTCYLHLLHLLGRSENPRSGPQLKAAGSAEMSVSVYLTTLSVFPVEGDLNIHRRESLRSQINKFLFKRSRRSRKGNVESNCAKNVQCLVVSQSSMFSIDWWNVVYHYLGVYPYILKYFGYKFRPILLVRYCNKSEINKEFLNGIPNCRQIMCRFILKGPLRKCPYIFRLILLN